MTTTTEPTVYPTQTLETGRVLADIRAERSRQREKHGDQTHLPDGTGSAVAKHLAKVYRKQCQDNAFDTGDGTVSFQDILLEEVWEALAEADPAALRKELIQVAAVATQWVEAIDQRPSEVGA